ncbi:hypothetical protein PCL_07426 [Purpureocillium lilacinum]|uniref:Extracellular protein n=1 Tax=Purpureocillium lilacinum TaxID=33203 RepID=A0A2U3DS97_PURLI|nr:hypothetical protein PCL_07426 [Purpureocillium lilacinum]
MQLKYPPPFKSKLNPNVGAEIDYNINAPLKADGSDFPCKGYTNLLGTPGGAPVAQWVAGQSYYFSLTGGTAGGITHTGGSCQASVSFDRGKTWKVLHSYIGNCPAEIDVSYPFTLPSDTPAGEMLFAWTWFNRIGNREMYMNCASVIVNGTNEKKSDSKESLDLRPAMFVANVGNGVCTHEGKDVEFPQPGPEVTRDSQGTAGPGIGQCHT